MASNLSKATVLRAVPVRCFSSGANHIPVSGVPNYCAEISKLQNGLKVVSTENCSPLARISILFKAGSRFENYETLGVTHVLRIAAGLSTQNATQFSIMRHIQQVGASLTCSTDREVISYTLEGTREAVKEASPFFAEVATKQVFRPWEISDNTDRLKLELKIRPYELRALDLLHKAAYRDRGLGNSLFIGKTKIGKISSETLQHYFCQHFVASKGTVAAVGFEHNDVLKFAEKLKIRESCDENCMKSTYTSGEARLEKGGNLTYIAMGKEGGRLIPSNEALVYGILQHVYGTKPGVPYGAGGCSVLARCVTSNVPSASVQAINANYSDSGLFGVLVCVPAANAGTAVSLVAKALSSTDITEADVKRGKAQLMRSMLSSLESGANIVENLGIQALFSDNALDAVGISNAIAGISPNDVIQAARKVASSKLSIASIGNLKTVPFLDELTC
ncbi:cytochrome b-c1 complex subunit 2, mitochondrial [Agrilus planipennis]|uniref:Cytochrome b-c1 complex subunit 2, mitochondrial n=1 Tax=Agrilus planipennis TaxID=224129 RepID=A0A7F5RM46_AGRPL|nr:cytochrome b-c1 complex subunit 2, mitochondrial [Agrilus planipennis]